MLAATAFVAWFRSEDVSRRRTEVAIHFYRPKSDNTRMRAIKTTGVAPDALTDLEAVCQQAASGGVKDPELIRRVTERAQQARQRMREKFGLQDIGVQIIREMRGDLPES
jgi:hypothetical protein